jgi:Ca2+-binding RTX toxin-like protein
MVGGSENDLIFAEVGDNRIWGAAGNDTIVAGIGKDIISGNDGADVFVFNYAASIGTGAARDIITDFTSGVDKIDLQNLNSTYNGASGLSGGGQGSFYYYQAAGLLIGDVDGNASVDWVLELSGTPTLLATDFLL